MRAHVQWSSHNGEISAADEAAAVRHSGAPVIVYQSGNILSVSPGRVKILKGGTYQITQTVYFADKGSSGGSLRYFCFADPYNETAKEESIGRDCLLGTGLAGVKDSNNQDLQGNVDWACTVTSMFICKDVSDGDELVIRLWKSHAVYSNFLVWDAQWDVELLP